MSQRIIGSHGFLFVLLSYLNIDEIQTCMNVFVKIGEQRLDRSVRDSMAFWSSVEDVCILHIDSRGSSLTSNYSHFSGGRMGVEGT